jgi:hypothetical protein
MNRRFIFAAALAGLGVMAVFALYAGAQAPVPAPPPVQPQFTQPPGPLVVRQLDDGTLVEETLDGKVVRTTAAGVGAPGKAGLTFQPRVLSDGRTVYVAGGHPAPDAETLKLATQEQAAAQEARTLAGQYAAADSDAAREEAKKKLREKLAAIFDLQQQRRAREVAQIEERLGKLKETMKKRDTSKDPIIDRRLDQLTGGVDELGWEEPGASPYGYGTFTVPQPSSTRYDSGGTTLPSPVPVPPKGSPGANPLSVSPPAR